MPKLDGKLMHSSLQALCKPDEKYYYPVYGNVGKVSKWSTSPMNNIYGFVAVTDLQRLLVAEFSMLGVPMGDMSIPLKLIKSMEVSKTIFGQNCVKLVIDNQGKDYKVQFTFANNVYGMGISNQKENLAGLIKHIENREEMQPSTQSQPATEKPAPKKVHKGPDYVAMLNREKEYTLSLCERLEAKYGKVEFGAPVTEKEMVQWETENQVMIPEDLKEWLRFAGKSKFKGISLEFYPVAQFKKEQDYVIIGERENTSIAFETEKDRYIAIESGNRKNLGHMESILRFWYYDAKELFAEEELEKLHPVIEEEKLKMEQAQQRAKLLGGIKEAMEYFLAKNNIGYLYKWRTFPKCPIRKDNADCELIIAGPDRDGYYQWKPQEQTTSIDFASIEKKLGFSIHKDIKEFISSYFYFMLEGDMDEKKFHIYPLLPNANIEKYVMDGFEKESYAGDYDFIWKGQFFQLGGACIDGDDSYILEINNKTGEVMAVEYMDKRHEKFADSLYDLFMSATPIWYKNKNT